MSQKQRIFIIETGEWRGSTFEAVDPGFGFVSCHIWHGHTFIGSAQRACNSSLQCFHFCISYAADINFVNIESQLANLKINCKFLSLVAITINTTVQKKPKNLPFISSITKAASIRLIANSFTTENTGIIKLSLSKKICYNGHILKHSNTQYLYAVVTKCLKGSSATMRLIVLLKKTLTI